MKKILITGANSYIGTSFERYITENFPEQYKVDIVDMLDSSWRKKDFSSYDSVFHVAGIAHRKETKENAHLYYEVNRDLAIETAAKAKVDGVRQFVFLSSMSVYGLDTGTITAETVPNPKSNYGKSKLQAEEGMISLADEHFKVCILRPPMVYGKGCKGNFQTVLKLVKMSPVFPKIKNERSMIYIENLCEFVRLCVEKESDGLYFPQNKEYVCTSDLAKYLSIFLNKKIHLSSLLGLMVKTMIPFVPNVRKAFGTLVYTNIEPLLGYKTYTMKESIEKSI